MVIKPKLLILVLVIMIIFGVIIIFQERVSVPSGEEAKTPIDVCKGMGDEKENCLKSAAIAENDPTLCESITEKEYMKFECYAEMALQLEDSELCKKITHKLEYAIEDNALTISEDECYWWYSLALDNVETCSNIANEGMKSKCEQGLEPQPIL